MPVLQCETDESFQSELANAGSKLVVADFFAVWCGPCRRIAPAYEHLSNKYSNTVFLKVDVDKCQQTAITQDVKSMPTFILYKNKVKLDMCKGDINRVEELIRQFGGVAGGPPGADQGETSAAAAASATDLPAGHIDLSTFVDKSQSECLNESDEHGWQNVLSPGDAQWLESDCDAELILALSFSQPVKMHSLKIIAPTDTGPKDVKLFINQPKTIDFDQGKRMEALQTLTLTAEDLETGKSQLLKFVKLQNVNNITLFLANNQTGSETTRVDQICIIGSPVQQTNMNDFKRVAGKKGEAH